METDMSLTSDIIYFIIGVENNTIYGWCPDKTQAEGELAAWATKRYGIEVKVVEGKEWKVA